MVDSQYHVRFHILSTILTSLFKKKVTVTGFNHDHYGKNTAHGYINIRFDSFLATERELFYKVLRIIRETLAQGVFVVDSVFGHADVEDGTESYIWVSDDKLPFEWSCCLPEDGAEDSLRCGEVYDDGSIATVFTLKYSIAMDRKVCISDDYAPENSTHLDQLREDIEILWGKNTQQTYNLYGSLQGVESYEIDLYGSGQDIFISASIVRAFKEEQDLCSRITGLLL